MSNSQDHFICTLDDLRSMITDMLLNFSDSGGCENIYPYIRDQYLLLGEAFLDLRADYMEKNPAP